MMNSTEEFFLDKPWAQITEPCYPQGRRLYLHDDRFWVSMDQNYRVLFFVQGLGGESIKPLENLAGLNVVMEKAGQGSYRLVCRLTLDGPEALEKFGTVAKDIAFHCSKYKGSQLFLKTQERIKSWANFLKPSRAGLTQSEFVGFFGELYVLSQHLMPALSALDAVRAWIGPEGKKQDFTFNRSAIEVKTTMSGDRQTIPISSLDQLDRVTLNLYLMKIVASPSGDNTGFSLASLYDRCIEYISHDIGAEGLFIQKASALFGKATEPQLTEQYCVGNVSFFHVTDDFPKLTRGDVDLAIHSVGYEILVAALSEFEVSVDIAEIVNNG